MTMTMNDITDKLRDGNTSPDTRDSSQNTSLKQISFRELSSLQGSGGFRRTASSNAIGNALSRMEGKFGRIGAPTNINSNDLLSEAQCHNALGMSADGMDGLECSVEREGIAGDAVEDAGANAFERAYRYLLAHGEDNLANVLLYAHARRLKLLNEYGETKMYYSDDDDNEEEGESLTPMDSLKRLTGHILNRMFQIDDLSTRFFLVVVVLSSIATYRVWVVRTRQRFNSRSSPSSSIFDSLLSPIKSRLESSLPRYATIAKLLSPISTKVSSIFPVAIDLDPRFTLLPPTLAVFSFCALSLKFLNWSRIAPTYAWANQQNRRDSIKKQPGLDENIDETLRHLRNGARSKEVSLQEVPSVVHEFKSDQIAHEGLSVNENQQQSRSTEAMDETVSIARSVARSIGRSVGRSYVYAQTRISPTSVKYDPSTGNQIIGLTISFPHQNVCCRCQGTSEGNGSEAGNWRGTGSDFGSMLSYRLGDKSRKNQRVTKSEESVKSGLGKKVSNAGILLVLLYALMLQT